jgi:antitoxin component YwqK of YwqJK toxin-antitoxin module
MKTRTSFVRDGVTVTLEDGVLESEVPLGAGVSRFFHPNGMLRAEVPKIDGRLHGIARDWHDNGQLFQEAEYIEGHPTNA